MLNEPFFFSYPKTAQSDKHGQDDTAGWTNKFLAKIHGHRVGVDDDLGSQHSKVGDVGQEIAHDHDRNAKNNDAREVTMGLFHFARDIVEVIPSVIGPET